MVFQSYALYPHLTVFENMSFSLKIAKRPEDLQLVTQSDNSIEAKVALIESLGEYSLIYAKTEKDAETINLIAKVMGTPTVKQNDVVHLSVPIEKSHLFAESGDSLA